MNLPFAGPLVLAIPETRRYPEWRSLRKTRGAKDASLRSRSNRRKAQRKAGK
jgi:hypothetical protein